MVGTMSLDLFTSNSCEAIAQKLPPETEAVIVFTIGDIVNPYSYSFSQPATVVWSGDCVGTGVQCTIVGPCFGGGGAERTCPALGMKTATARVTYLGVTRLYSITGYDGTYYGNPI